MERTQQKPRTLRQALNRGGKSDSASDGPRRLSDYVTRRPKTLADVRRITSLLEASAATNNKASAPHIDATTTAPAAKTKPACSGTPDKPCGCKSCDGGKARDTKSARSDGTALQNKGEIEKPSKGSATEGVKDGATSPEGSDPDSVGSDGTQNGAAGGDPKQKITVKKYGNIAVDTRGGNDAGPDRDPNEKIPCKWVQRPFPIEPVDPSRATLFGACMPEPPPYPPSADLLKITRFITTYCCTYGEDGVCNCFSMVWEWGRPADEKDERHNHWQEVGTFKKIPTEEGMSCDKGEGVTYGMMLLVEECPPDFVWSPDWYPAFEGLFFQTNKRGSYSAAGVAARIKEEDDKQLREAPPCVDGKYYLDISDDESHLTGEFPKECEPPAPPWRGRYSAVSPTPPHKDRPSAVGVQTCCISSPEPGKCIIKCAYWDWSEELGGVWDKDEKHSSTKEVDCAKYKYIPRYAIAFECPDDPTESWLNLVLSKYFAKGTTISTPKSAMSRSSRIELFVEECQEHCRRTSRANSNDPNHDKPQSQQALDECLAACERTIRAMPSAADWAGGGGQAGVYGRMGARQYVDALKSALDRARTRWWEVLPDCPCIMNGDAKPPTGWCFDFHKGREEIYSGSGFHDGAQFCVRSFPNGSHGHAQQCCYDDEGNLITSGEGSGTPDFSESTNRIDDSGECRTYGTLRLWNTRTKHFWNDVSPAIVLGWKVYNLLWPPNRGVECADNPKP